jgi:hypothetical protein
MADSRHRVFHVHWNEQEAKERAASFRAPGFALEGATLNHPAGKPTWRALRADPPAVFLIDLSRLPAHGRAVAIVLRENGKTRYVPIVFVDGDPVKVKKIRSEVPDAIYCEWSGLEQALRAAISTPPPLLPKGAPRREHKPLAQKLGLVPKLRVWLLDAPEGFVESLKEAPKDIRFETRRRGEHDLAIVFVARAAELAPAFDLAIERLTDRGAVWVAWPKKSAGAKTDVTIAAIGHAAKARGFSGYKICAFDAAWAGVRLARKRAK